MNTTTIITTTLWAHTKETFTKAKSWVTELQREASPNIAIALSGNKADLDDKREVEFEVSVGVLVYVCMCIHVFGVCVCACVWVWVDAILL